MPFYDYKCVVCDKIEEFMLSMSHNTPKCPTCEKNMSRVYTEAPPVHFKGTGWTEKTSATTEKHAKLEKARKLATVPGF